jgi:transcriptional regulator with XRE-family HTH domain
MNKQTDKRKARAVKKSGIQRQTSRQDDLLTSSTHIAAGKKEASATLGDRFRLARESRGLTLKDICNRTGISLYALKRVESNEFTPPLGQLIKLGKALDMKMGYFISPGVDRPVVVVRSDERRPVSRYGEKQSAQYGYYYESLASQKANRVMEPFIVTLVPSKKEELSTHDGQEFLFVLSGKMKVRVGVQEEILEAGDAVYYDSNKPHYVGTVGKKKTTILAVLYAGAK